MHAECQDKRTNAMKKGSTVPEQVPKTRNTNGFRYSPSRETGPFVSQISSVPATMMSRIRTIQKSVRNRQRQRTCDPLTGHIIIGRAIGGCLEKHTSSQQIAALTNRPIHPC